MKALAKVTALAVMLGMTVPVASPGHAQPMMGMMNGGCPMMDMTGWQAMGPGMMGQDMMGQGMMGQGMMNWHPDMEAVAIGRLAYLEAELGIADSQRDAWNGYADALKDRMAGMRGMHQTMMSAMQGGDMVARLDARIAAMEAMVEALKAQKPAAEALYTVLNDEQKQKADLLLGMGCGGM